MSYDVQLLLKNLRVVSHIRKATKLQKMQSSCWIGSSGSAMYESGAELLVPANPNQPTEKRWESIQATQAAKVYQDLKCASDVDPFGGMQFFNACLLQSGFSTTE